MPSTTKSATNHKTRINPLITTHGEFITRVRLSRLGHFYRWSRVRRGPGGPRNSRPGGLRYREACATGSRPIGTAQAIGNRLYINRQTALISCGFGRQAIIHGGRSERRVCGLGQSPGHYLEVITHDRQSHGRAETMTITRGHGQQKLPITPAMAAEDSLADDGGDKGARIAHGQPLLPGFSFAIFRLGATQIELDALIVSLAGVDLLEHRTIAFNQPGGVHARKKVQLVVGIIAVDRKSVLEGK